MRGVVTDSVSLRPQAGPRWVPPDLAHNKCLLSLVQNQRTVTLELDSFLGARSGGCLRREETGRNGSNIGTPQGLRPSPCRGAATRAFSPALDNRTHVLQTTADGRRQRAARSGKRF